MAWSGLLLHLLQELLNLLQNGCHWEANPTWASQNLLLPQGQLPIAHNKMTNPDIISVPVSLFSLPTNRCDRTKNHHSAASVASGASSPLSVAWQGSAKSPQSESYETLPENTAFHLMSHACHRCGCGSRIGTPNGTLASGRMDQDLWSPGGLILTHAHVSRRKNEAPQARTSSAAAPRNVKHDVKQLQRAEARKQLTGSSQATLVMRKSMQVESRAPLSPITAKLMALL